MEWNGVYSTVSRESCTGVEKICHDVIHGHGAVSARRSSHRLSQGIVRCGNCIEVQICECCISNVVLIVVVSLSDANEESYIRSAALPCVAYTLSYT